ncbi:ABC transporter ATP-binding protein [Pseudoflavitalea sp. G-6-1-2]|uniref:ABC transporter ATP-binding protein n=1 Tax=Pseudoflavitalea sp. G-6-1-2 TaxID=2728841 RepID=UPI00146AAF89|nr:ABC transporter ATP-binding protein [Pseudoflavitalea sp. G-6-1-2]NML22766.1 ABC transporter ATP-binding protein [Pseudoflavitalea sp. G-6-1-2]
MNSFMIETQRLDFTFRSGQPILQQLDLQVPTGSIYGFLGPNGAGKTTTLRLILGLLKLQKGSIRIFGENLQTNRISILNKLGALIEQPSFYLHLTGKENLELFRLTFQCAKSRIDDVLKIVGLTDAAHKKASAYSLGMKQRLAIAIALLNDPQLLILDEPTNGLDPSGIIETRELIIKLNKEEGKTILVSSHLLSEMEKMATHIGIIHKGKLLFQGSMGELRTLQASNTQVTVEVNDTVRAVQLLAGFPVQHVNGQGFSVGFESRARTAALNKALVEGGVEVYQVSVEQHDLENLFVQITNQ